ncbi:MAG: hypothetical protein ACI8ZB_002906 [Desulforhopalus sp.]|jgi:hypothetical protein
MSENLISLFIDDEMKLDEKIIFVETVHSSKHFAEEAVTLLEQEQLLCTMPTTLSEPVLNRPHEIHYGLWFDIVRSWLQPAAGFVTALLLVGLSFLFIPEPPTINPLEEHRFVLYLPQADQAKIVGTFTNWNPVSMKKIGTSGYWDLTLNIPQGEHRYSYMVEDGSQMLDPTVVAREHDDFGGENSVIIVGGENGPIS